MADCSCDFCNHNWEYENDCPYAYAASYCSVDRIKGAKAVVDEEFLAFQKRLKTQNEKLDDDQIECLIGAMQDIVYNSQETLPEWAYENDTDTQEENVCRS